MQPDTITMDPIEDEAEIHHVRICTRTHLYNPKLSDNPHPPPQRNNYYIVSIEAYFELKSAFVWTSMVSEVDYLSPVFIIFFTKSRVMAKTEEAWVVFFFDRANLT